MRVLFAGLGSIGQRHMQNLLDLAGQGRVNHLEMAAWRSSDREIYLRDGRAEEGGPPLAERYGFTPVSSLAQGLEWGADTVFVCNPSALHMSTALAAARAGCDLFIEKPLSHTAEGLDELAGLVEEKGLTALVGFQFQYHPAVRAVSDLLAGGELGRPLSAHFDWGAHLPSFHPYEDYRLSYAARRDLGGGAALSLIHEIDLIAGFFGEPDRVCAAGGTLSSLQMDAEDTVGALLGYGRMPVTLHLCMAQRPERRGFRITLDKGAVFCDLASGQLEIHGPDEARQVLDYADHARNRLFMDELRDFLAARQARVQPRAGLASGVRAQKLALRLVGALHEQGNAFT